MDRWRWCFTLLSLIACVSALDDLASPRPVLVINTLTPVRNVTDEFLSVALDTEYIRSGRVPNLKSKKLQERTALLGPAYLRVGGTSANCLIFDEDNYSQPKVQDPSMHYLDGDACAFEDGLSCRERPPEFNMTAQTYMDVYQFSQDIGLKLIFDLNILLRKGEKWDSTNPKKLIEFSQRHNYSISWQLGNEPNSFPHSFEFNLTGIQLGEDFVTCRNLLNNFPSYKNSKLVGPDITNPKFPMQTPAEYLREFLKGLKNNTKTVDTITWHQYYLDGNKAVLENFTDPKVFNVLEKQINAVRKTVDDYLPNIPLWLTETGSAYGGGAVNLSDRFVAGFLWLDKLGVSARMSVEVVVRQSLLSGQYALLNHRYDTNPDYWLSMVFKKLVGRTVLNVGGSELPHGTLRLYGHCTRNSKSITIYGMNLKDETVQVDIPAELSRSGGYKTEYILTGSEGLLSRDVLLNGQKLTMGEDNIPPPFVGIDSSLSEPLTFPPYSMGFWVLNGINAPACQ